MSKKNIRMLALGFFVSGVILLLTSFFTPDNQSVNGETEVVEGLNSEIAYLEEKIAKLEIAQTTQAEELAAETEQPVEPEQDGENTENTETDEEQAAEDTIEEETTEEPIITTTVTIAEGEPSSVATQQLESEGIIEDRFEFDNFLEDNDYAPLVRPGSYDITSEMSFEEIAQKLIGR